MKAAAKRTSIGIASGPKPGTVKFLHKIRALLGPLELLLIATGAVTLFGSVLLYVAVAQQLQWMAWIETTTVYPSRTTRDSPLPLTYAGKRANDVRIASLRIVNVGSNYIGEQQPLWKLHFWCPEAESVAVIGEPFVVPESTVRAPVEQTTANLVSLPLGVFEPRGELTLHTMVVNPRTPYIRCKVSSSLTGVPNPKVGGSLWGQFAERFLPLAACSSLIFAGILFVRRVRAPESAHAKRRWLSLAGLLLKYALGWAAAAIFLSLALGLLAEGIFRAPAVYEAIVQRLG